MIEMLIVAAIVAKLGLDSAGKFAVDVGFGVRGKASPRLAEARARRPRGAASSYFSELWDDAWTDASRKHAARRERSSSPSRPRGAARIYLSNLWRDGWDRAERKRQEKATRPRPGQQTVPGTVVPNADEREAEPPVRSWIWRRVGWKCRICGSTQGVAEISFGEGFKRFNTRLRYCPKHMADYGPGGTKIDYGPESPWAPGDDERDEDGDRPQPAPVPDEDETVPQDEHPDLTEDRDEDEQDEPTPGPESVPDSGPDSLIPPEWLEGPATPTTEGTTTMSTITGEVTGLDTAIRFCEDSARGYQAQIHQIELAKASLTTAEATAVAGPLTSAMEMTEAAASAMKQAEAELRKQIPIAELYRANPGAATKDFMLQG